MAITSLVILSVVCAVALLWVRIGQPMVNFVKDPQVFRDWVQEKGVWGGAAYVGMCIFQVILAVLPGEPFEIAGGYAFGWLWGALLCIAGETLGGLCTFAFVKRFGKKAAQFLASREKLQKLAFLRDESKLRRLTLLLFVLPGTPKDLLTYAMALTPLTVPDFLLMTSVARIPSVVTSTLGGHALGEKRYLFAVIVFAVTLALSLAGLQVYNAITKRRYVKKRPRTYHRPRAFRRFKRSRNAVNI